MSKQVQFTFDNLTLSSRIKKLESSEIVSKCIRCVHWLSLNPITTDGLQNVNSILKSHASHCLHYLQGMFAISHSQLTAYQ